MKTAIAWLANLFQLGYSLMFFGVGFAGVLLARWELSNVFDVTGFSALPQHGATLLGQYRFLKSVEFCAGLFGLVRRKAILAGEAEAGLFLAIVAAGVVARTVAWLADGQPSWPFQLFLLLEVLTFVFVALHVRDGNVS